MKRWGPWAATGLLLLLGWILLRPSQPCLDCEPILLRIPPGSSLRTVADSLAAHDLIDFPPGFRLRARLAQVDRRVRPGIYQFQPGVSTGEIIHYLAQGKSLIWRITVPEGSTLYDLARFTARKFGVQADSLLAASRDPALLREFAIDAPSAEGWLLPETFDFDGFVTSRDILTRFIQARLSTWDSSWDARLELLRWDREQLLTLASIVEAEARFPEELPLIAAVYRNRLKIGMPLQADPTIQYGYLVNRGERKSRLTYADYQFLSPWNSYLHPGLPPGPIGNPSARAIEAVLEPAPVNYLYFVADSTGHHRFSASYPEHLRAIHNLRH